MPYIPPSVVREVKRMDLLTYLKNYEPYELVHFSGNGCGGAREPVADQHWII